MTAQLVYVNDRQPVVSAQPLVEEAHGNDIAFTRVDCPTPGQLWERLAAHSEAASGYEEDVTSSGEVDNYKDTDEYLFSED